MFGPTFWVALSFVIFIALAAKPVVGFIISSLDKRASEIKEELNEALRLKEDAQALLASYQRKQREIADEAKAILDNAEKEAERIAQTASKELEESLNKRIDAAMQKIASYEASVLQQIRNNSIDIAVSAVRALVVENSNTQVAEKLVNRAIADVNKKLH